VAIFSYSALTLNGERAQGTETADSVEHLREILAARDLILKSGRAQSSATSSRRPPFKHIANFNRELTVLLQAGLSIPESLALLAVRPGQPRLEKALRVVLSEVNRGSSLREGMSKAQGAFDADYIALVGTGEEAGALPNCLQRYQNYADLKMKMRAQVLKTMTYPAALLVTLSAVLTFLFLEVIPNFIGMYRELGSELPAPTQILIAIERHFPAIAIGITATVIGVWLLDRLAASTAKGGIMRDRLLLQIPILGGFRRISAAAATARMLSIMIASGATVTKALTLATKSVSDRYFAHFLDDAKRAVQEGVPLSKALASGGLFRPMSLKMIAAGEASGSLDSMLGAVAAQQEEELADSLARLTSLMEPAVLLIAGFLVGGVVVAMYLPIFTLTELIK